MWQGHEWGPDVPIFGCWKMMMMMACLKQTSSPLSGFISIDTKL